ncbi:MAG: acyltransferase domain-containing protein [Polyangiaceae bacterium]
MTNPTSESLRSWLVSRLASLRGVEPRTIDTHERFSRYGLDSLGAGKMIADLGGFLGRPLMPTLVWEYPTIDALAAHLSGEGAGAGAGAARAETAHANEPIAIVGMACRFPMAPDPGAYWHLLANGIDAITEVPEGRWDAAALFDPDPAAPGKLTTRWGGFLDQVDGFDPQFFGISPREAIQMDPQQRLAMELTWEALEDAGIPPHRLKGSPTSVFIGAMWNDYARLPGSGTAYVTQHTATGQDLSIIPARVSYTLGLRGASVAVNTACSSSLVAVHLARQSLLSGESTLAIAGGVNLMISPLSTIAMSKLGALSPDGRCKTFDARANGYVRSEGAGVVVLERLSQALAQGHAIHGLLLGSAINNDGFSNGLTAPSPKAQELVLQSAYASAGVEPASVDYVEAHGTGTPLGDPIEAAALGAVLGAGRPADRPLVVGSAKSNVGHLESAAGVAGMMKILLSMRHRQIPASLHFEQPNPHIPFDALGLRVQAKRGPWPRTGERAIAGVSSFGFGGTNSHVVLESAPAHAVHVLPISAPSDSALRRRAEELRAAATSDEPPALGALCAAAGARLAGEAKRLSISARDAEGAATAIDAWLGGAPRPGTFAGEAKTARKKPVFVFSGHGSQWVGMGRALLLEEPAFRGAVQACDRAMQPHLGASVMGILSGEGSAWLEDTALLQPLIFTVQVGLARLLRTWGVEPGAVVGQSIGEIAAAHVAGCLGLDDAARVICESARAVKQASGRGGAAAFELPLAEAEKLLAGKEDRVSVAVQTSPSSTVLSGDAETLDALVAEVESRGVFARRVKIDYPSHTAHLADLREDLVRALGPVRPHSGSVPFFSTVVADPREGTTLDAEYWWRSVREPVALAPALAKMLAEGFDTFLELAPHPMLLRGIEQCAAHAGVPVTALSTLRRDEDDRAALRDMLGALYVRGADIAWDRVEPAEALSPSELAALGIDVTGTTARAEAGLPVLLALSGHKPEALAQGAGNLSNFLRDRAGIAVRDAGYTAAVRREHLDHRAAIVASTREELIAGLDALAKGTPTPGTITGRASKSARAGAVFVFPGQGSQWVGMGRQLLAREPVFREAIAACDAAIARESGFSVIAEIGADAETSQLGRIGVVQPFLFAIEVALAALWRSRGVQPACVIGHSMGEVAAAHVAGMLSLEDAAKVICRRSKLLSRVSGNGAMAVVELTIDETAAAIAAHRDRLGVAVSNAPRSTVISGDPAALEEVLSVLEKRGVFCRRVKVDVASHSPQMDPLRAELVAALADLQPRAGTVAMRSTVTGELVDGTTLTAEYWASNLREPVLFSAATQRTMALGAGVFIEMSPHPILLPAIQENLAEAKQEGAAIASLRREADEERTLLEGMAAAHVAGLDAPWPQDGEDGARLAPLPLYPWQRERLWLSPEDLAEPAARRAREGEHPLLGAPFSPAAHTGERFWERTLGAGDLAWIADHQVQGEVVFPGAGYVEMALAAATDMFGAGTRELSEMSFQRMLAFPPGASPAVQVAVSDTGTGTATVTITSRAPGASEWSVHANGTLRVAAGDPPAPQSIAALRERCPRELPGAEHYARMEARALPYGPCFRGVERVWLGEGEALAELRLPPSPASEAGQYRIHPALLDVGLQVALELLPSSAPKGTFVPIGAGPTRLHRAPKTALLAHVRAEQPEEGSSVATFDLTLLDTDGEVVFSMTGLRMAPLEGGGGDEASLLENTLYTAAWRPEPLATSGQKSGGSGAWLVLSDGSGTGAAIAARLRSRGLTCVEARTGGEFAREEEHRYRIRAGHPADLDKLLASAFGKQDPCLGVLHCAGLDAAPWESTTAQSLQADLRTGTLLAVQVAQALLRQGARDTPRLVLVTRAAQAVPGPGEPLSVAQAPLWGLGRAIALEHPELEPLRIDLPRAPLPDEAEQLVNEILAPAGDDQVALRPEGRFVARLTRGRGDTGADEPLAPAAGRAFRVEVREPGVLDRLSLREIARRPPGPGEVEIEVEATGLNFLDVLLALGVLKDDVAGHEEGSPRLGLECAGRVVGVGPGVTDLAVGQEVMALSMAAMSTHVVARRELVVAKPAGLSLVEAATLPIVFATAYYSLAHVARLSRGERVLIHAGAGGVGMAAIQWAQHVGAEVFATAGSPAKRELLRSLGVQHVMDSRSLSFVDDVRRATGGEGVDVVLNSLSGELLVASFGLLRDYGRFVEIGKRDYYDNRQLGLRPFLRNLSFTLVDLRGMMLDRPDLVSRVMGELAEHFAAGTLRPLPAEVQPASRAHEVFETMAKARHTGKLAVRMAEPDARILPRKASGAVVKPDATYLLTGGLGGLGLSVARWLVERGARHLALVGRRPPSPGASEAIRAMEAMGAEVRALRADVSEPAEVESPRHGAAADAAAPGRRPRGRPPRRPHADRHDGGPALVSDAPEGAGRVEPPRRDSAPPARLLRALFLDHIPPGLARARCLLRRQRLPRRARRGLASRRDCPP